MEKVFQVRRSRLGLRCNPTTFTMFVIVVQSNGGKMHPQGVGGITFEIAVKSNSGRRCPEVAGGYTS